MRHTTSTMHVRGCMQNAPYNVTTRVAIAKKTITFRCTFWAPLAVCITFAYNTRRPPIYIYIYIYIYITQHQYVGTTGVVPATYETGIVNNTWYKVPLREVPRGVAHEREL